MEGNILTTKYLGSDAMWVITINLRGLGDLGGLGESEGFANHHPSPTLHHYHNFYCVSEGSVQVWMNITIRHFI